MVLAVCGPHPCAGEASRMNRPPRVGVGWRKADPLHPSSRGARRGPRPSRMTERKATAKTRSLNKLVVVGGQVCEVSGAGEDFVQEGR